MTLYIDVYFLINFTVDVLSLYFAAIFSKIPTTSRRLIISALLGAFFAVGIVFLPEIPLLKLISSAVSLFIIGYAATKRVKIKRKIKFIFAFLLFEALFGGVVSFLWGILDSRLSNFFSSVEGGAVNRKMLFFSIIVLLSIGVFKMLVSFFSNIQSEGSVEVEISFLDKSARLEAFIDSGNLAVDPMDMTPVMLLKKDAAANLLPDNIINLSDPDTIEKNARKRIRLIPISRGGATHVLTGVKPDSVKILKEGKTEEISVTIAIDKEGGTYGGFGVLMPSAALDDVVL
ncbi:MAG: hypothetical protein E7676_03080 [Ruminococcaceae bacterium]|nr:hypothetical protein [Oscillospiraceae bacterium]